MAKLTQAELLSEGFWSNFKKPFKVAAGVARGGIAGAAKALDYALPELTSPIKSAEDALRDIGDTAKQGYDRYAKGVEEYAADNLEEQGYKLDPKASFKRRGDNYVVSAYKIIRYNNDGSPQLQGNPVPFLIDKQGNILKSLRHR